MKLFSKIILSGMSIALAVNLYAAKPEVIAHRGYWKTEGSSQNSIRSLVKADSIKCYGSEFDVWMTKDGVLVVNHDPKINGIDIVNANASEVTSQVLSNGENVSTLDQYMEAAKGVNTRLIFELKKHKDKNQEKKAVKDIIKLMKKKKLTKRVEYITFSKEAMLDLIKLAPKGTPVYYLNGDMTPSELKAINAAGMDYHIKKFIEHPEWIEECHNLGLKVNVWTANKEEDMVRLIDQGVDFITTDEPEKLQKLIENKYK